MTDASVAPRIFVSYARSDGKEIAANLRRRLQAEGFALWQDLTDMEGGKEWWRQITSVIDQIEYLLLVMTPNALRSKVVRDEWRYGRQQGRCVIPIKGAASLDDAQLAGWMRRTQFVDVGQEEQWHRLVNTLRGGCQATRVPFMVDDLPENFVARPTELDALIAGLLDENCEEPIAITAALRGAGGYGKTTLARAICHDERIQDAYHDGVLWVTLGEEPGDLGGRVADLIHTLTGKPEAFATLDAAVNRMREALADRRILIVIDDVWKVAHARPFLQGGRNCARLMTTRYTAALPDDARQIPVDAMQVSEAVELLHSEPPADQLDALKKLASRLGEWPLLLKLVASALREQRNLGKPLADAVAYVNKALDRKGFTAFDSREAEDRHQAVAATLRMSLDQLADEERERFESLAIFPEDTDIPLNTAELLWALDDFDTEEVCRRLFGLSLLWSLDLATRRLRLHGVVRSYLCDQQKGRLPELHSRLIEAYRARCPDGWHTGPDDGYFFQHLPYHLAEAGRADERRALLFDYLWLRRKLEVAGVNRLIEDLAPLQGDAEARSLASTLRLSAHALNHQPRQLAAQLLGRLANTDGPTIGTLLDAARNGADRPSLTPLRRSLTPPGGPLLATLEGHSAEVAVTPDGRRAVSSDNATLKVWDLENGTLLRTLSDHHFSKFSVAVKPDGRRVAVVSGSDDATLKVWDLEQGTLVSTLEDHGPPVEGVAVTPDGRRVAVVSIPRRRVQTLKVWDLEQGTLLWTLEEPGPPVRRVAVTPDGRRVAVVSGLDDATLKVWDLEQGALLSTLEGHDFGVFAVAVTPDGRYVAVSGSDYAGLKVWDLEQGVLLSTLKGHGHSVKAVAVTPDGRRVAVVSGLDDATLKVWDLEQGALLSTLEGHDFGVFAVAVTPDGRYVAVSGSDDRTLKVWDLEQGARLSMLQGPVFAVAMTPDGRRLVSGSDCTLKVWDLEQGTLLSTLEGHGDLVRAVLTADGRRAVSGSDDRTLKVWDLERGRLLSTLEGHRGRVFAVAVTADGRRAVSGSGDHTLKVWDLEQGTLLTTLEGHGDSVTGVAVTPDGRRVVSSSWDRTLKVWDLERGTVLSTLDDRGRVFAVAVTADGRRAVSGSDDRTLKVWDLEEGTLLATLEGHGQGVWAVAVTPDGRHAVSATNDRTLRVWDLSTGGELAVFKGDAWFLCCAVALDGRFAVAGDNAGQIHVLEILL
jgi:WD40 repeat protein